MEYAFSSQGNCTLYTQLFSTKIFSDVFVIISIAFYLMDLCFTDGRLAVLSAGLRFADGRLAVLSAGLLFTDGKL